MIRAWAMMRTVGRVACEAALPVAIVALTVVLVWREPRFGFGNPDTVVYSVAADLWAGGAVPYRDFIDHKPPAIYLFYRLCFFLGGHQPRAIWQGFTLITGIVAVALYLGFRLVRRTAAGTATAFAFCVFLWTDPLQFGYFAWNQSESLAVFLGALAFTLLLVYQWSPRWIWAFGAGTAFGSAVLSKQPAALWALPLGVQLLAARRERPLRNAVAPAALAVVVFTLGTLLPWAVGAVYFASHRALYDFYDWVYLRNLTYAGIEHGTLNTHAAILIKSIRWLNKRLAAPFAWPFTGSLILLPLSLLLRRSWLDLCTVLWVLSSLAAVAVGILLVDHYIILMHFALALSFGCAVSWVYGIVGYRIRSPIVDALVVTVICCLLFIRELPILLDRLPGDLSAARQALEDSPDYQLGEELRAAAGPGDSLLVFGEPLAVVFFSGMRPASKYIYWPADTLRPDANEFLREVDAKRPHLAYIGRTAFRTVAEDQPGVHGLLARYLHEHYTLWLNEPSGRVYVRREGEAPADGSTHR